MAKVDYKEVTTKVQLCFDIVDVPTTKGSRKKKEYSCKFCADFRRKEFEGHQRPLEHIMGCSPTGANRKPCGEVPIRVRNEVRALYGLPEYTVPTEMEETQVTQRSLDEFREHEHFQNLERLQCLAWYANSIPFSVGSNIHMNAYLVALSKGPPPKAQNVEYKPLSKKQLADSDRIDKALEALARVEDAKVHASDGLVCMCSDGGKVQGNSTRSIIGECEQGSIWVVMYNAGENKKDASYLCKTTLPHYEALVRRGWKIVGGVTDNTGAEIASMQLIKAEFQKKHSQLYVVLGCGLHVGGLLQSDCMVAPPKDKPHLDKCPSFQCWRDLFQEIHDLSRCVKNRPKARNRLKRIIEELEQFKDMKFKLPMQGCDIKQWTVCLVLARFLELADPLRYLFTKYPAKWCDTEALPKVRNWGDMLQSGDKSLQAQAAELLAFVFPLYNWQKFCDANYTGGIFVTVEKWNVMEKAASAALRQVRTLPQKVVEAMLPEWEACVDHRRSMHITPYHYFAHCCRPSYLLQQTVEKHFESDLQRHVEFVIGEYHEFSLGPDKVTKRAIEDYLAILRKEGLFSLHDQSGQMRKMWKDAQDLMKSPSANNGSKDHRWWATHLSKTAPLLYSVERHISAMKNSEAGCERAYSAVEHVADGREKLDPEKLDKLTHLFWGYRSLAAAQSTQRVHKIKALCFSAQQHADEFADEAYDSEYGGDVPQDDGDAEAVAELLAVPEDDDALTRPSKYDDLAIVTVSEFVSLLPIIAGGLVSSERALPVLAEFEKLTVTKKSLAKLADVIQTVKSYADKHEDMRVRMKAASLREAWRTIFRQDPKES